MSIKQQLIELGNKYYELKKQLDEGKEVLENHMNNLVRLLKEDDRLEYKSIDENIWITMTEQETFNSKNFKDKNPNIYEEFRFPTKPSKRFSKKDLEEKRPKIFKKYCELKITKFDVKRPN